MADEIIYTPITDLKLRTVRVMGKRSFPKMESFTVSGWPNAIAETPEEAVGKLIKVQEGELEATFSIVSVDGDKLSLQRESYTDYDYEEPGA